MTSHNFSRIVLIALMAPVLLPGCALEEPDHFTPNKVRVQEEKVSHNFSAAELNAGAVAALAEDYRRYGDGPIDLTITYDAKARSGAMKASDEAVRLSGLLRKNGVRDVKTAIMPVHQSGTEMRVLVGYNGYAALAPKDCTMMTGLETRTVNVEEDYKLGCSTQTLFARQVARPKDLKGQGAADPTTDGRRSANIVEVYRTGAPNEPLDGENASE